MVGLAAIVSTAGALSTQTLFSSSRIRVRHGIHKIPLKVSPAQRWRPCWSTPVDETDGTDAAEDQQPPAPAASVAPTEELSPVEFVFGKPGEFERDLRAMGTTPRRFFLQLFFVAPRKSSFDFEHEVQPSFLTCLPE